MKILISGCSFTQWRNYGSGPNICWPMSLDPNWSITNVAEAAAGNQYICDSVIRSVLSERPDHVLVMWTGVSRLDYLTSLEDPAWDELFDSYGFFRRLPDGKLGWIFSGGQMGTWFKHPVAHKMFYEMYKVSSELSLATINFMEIVKLQNFLKNKCISYHFMSYVNYWNDRDNISPNGDFGVYRHPELKPLINEIDFAPWIFTNTDGDGIYEMAKKNNDFQEDGFHPGDATYQEWAKLVSESVQQHIDSNQSA